MSKGKTILVVDDEESIVVLLSFLLNENGYNVLTASDGISALNVTLHENPDLILLDIMLPGKSGFSVYNEIVMTRKIPVLFVTVLTLEQIRATLPMVNESHVFTKPLDDKRLLATIARILSEKDVTPVSSA